jgi:hypothetical protein
MTVMKKKLANKRASVRGRNDGQSLLLFAVTLPLLLILLAFVVDGAHAFVDYRQLQNAADASALAAAQDLGSSTCGSPPIPAAQQQHCVQNEATDYAYQNGDWPSTHGLGHDLQPCGSTGVQPPNGNPGSDVQGCFDWPYNGDPSKVLVKLRNCTATFVGKYFGVDKICADVRSVAVQSPLTHASTTPDTVLPDSTIPGTTIPGTTIPGTTIPGTTTPGATIPGTTIAGTTIAGTTTPGTTIPGTTNYTTSTSVTSTPGSGPKTALFAYNQANLSSCSNGIIVNAGNGNSNIDGAAISNGEISLNGNPQLNLTYADYSASCPRNFTSPGQVPAGNATTHSTPTDWLATFDAASICAAAGGVTHGAIVLDVSLSKGAPTSGVYCSDTSIYLTGNKQKTYSFTLIAPIVYLDAQNVNVSPSVQNLLVYETCGNAGVVSCASASLTDGHGTVQHGTPFVFAPNNQALTGTIWIPNGDFTYAGNSGTTGLYEAQHILIQGANSFTLHGSGPPVGGGTTTTTTTITNVTTGTTTPGTTVAGSTVAGTTVAGTTSSGTTTPGTTTPGSTNAGSTTPNTTIPGTTIPGTTTTSTTGTTLGLNQ